MGGGQGGEGGGWLKGGEGEMEKDEGVGETSEEVAASLLNGMIAA